jgi:hypothetical protein
MQKASLYLSHVQSAQLVQSVNHVRVYCASDQRYTVFGVRAWDQWIERNITGSSSHVPPSPQPSVQLYPNYRTLRMRNATDISSIRYLLSLAAVAPLDDIGSAGLTWRHQCTSSFGWGVCIGSLG